MKKYIIIPVVALSFVFAGTANAGFFDWFKNTPLNQEASIISATRDAESAKILELQTKATASKSSDDSSISKPSDEHVPTTGDSTISVAPFTKVIKSGEENDEVLKLQEVLVEKGYLSADKADGDYGKATQTAVKKFQKANKINGNGKSVGPATRKALNKMLTKTGNLTSSTTSGPIAKCPSTSTPQIRILSPNGGELYTAGQQILIKWTSCNIPSGYGVSANLIRNTGYSSTAGFEPVTTIPESGMTIASGVTANDGQELWNLPDVGESTVYDAGFGQVFKINLFIVPNITPSEFPQVYDFTDNLFSINGPQPQTCTLTSTPLSTPVSQNVPVGTIGFLFAQFKVKAVGCDIDLDRIKINVGGSIVPNNISTSINNIYVRENSGIVLGTATTVPGQSVYDLGVDSGYILQNGQAKTFRVYSSVIGGAGLNAKLGLSQIRGSNTQTNDIVQYVANPLGTTGYWGKLMNITSGTNQTAVPPTFVWQTLSTTTLTGSNNHLIGKLKITNPNTNVDVTFQSNNGNQIIFDLTEVVCDNDDGQPEALRFKDEFGNTLDVTQFNGVSGNEAVTLDFSSSGLSISPLASKIIYIYADTSDFESSGDSIQIWLNPNRPSAIQFGYNGSGNIGTYSNQIITAMGVNNNYAQIHVRDGGSSCGQQQAGSLTVSVDSSSPNSKILLDAGQGGNELLEVFRLSASSAEALDLDSFRITDGGDDNAIEMYYFQAKTPSGVNIGNHFSAAAVGGTAQAYWADNSVIIPANSYILMYIYGRTANIDYSTADNESTVEVTIAQIGDVGTTGTSSGVAINSTNNVVGTVYHYIFQSYPKFAWQTLSTTTLTGSGYQQIGKLKIIAVGNRDITFLSGQTSEIKFQFTQVQSDSDDSNAPETVTYKDYPSGNVLDTTTVADGSGTVEGTVNFSTSALTIPVGSSNTINIYMDTSDLETDGDSIQVWLDNTTSSDLSWAIDGQGDYDGEATILWRNDYMADQYAQLLVNPS